MQTNVCPVQMPRWAYLLIVGVVALVTAALRVAFLVDAMYLSYLYDSQTRTQERTERAQILRDANTRRLMALMRHDAAGRAQVAPAPPEAEPASEAGASVSEGPTPTTTAAPEGGVDSA